MRFGRTLRYGAALAALALSCAMAVGQEKGIFDVPKTALTKPVPPDTCRAALSRADALLLEVDRMLAATLKADIRKAVADRDKTDSEAEGWNAAAGVALINLHPAAALWAELNALKLEWSSEYAAQAGVYLAYFDRNDDAKLFLHCAYSAGNRSPFLLEALANVYRTTDKARASQYINEASTAAPDDELIEIEKALFNTGRPPPAPPSGSDAVDSAMAELKAHIDRVMTIFQRSEQLRSKVLDVYDGRSEGPDALIADTRRGYEDTLASLREPARLAKLTVAEIAQQNKAMGLPAANARTYYRNQFFYTAITMYLSLTEAAWTEPRAAEISERFDVGFWAKPMGLQPVEYARIIKGLEDFEYQGEKARSGGYHWENWGGARFYTFHEHAKKMRRLGHVECGRRNRDLAAEEACQLEVDKRYCVTARQLHAEWMTTTEALHEKLGRRFDQVAAAALIEAGAEVEDAFLFAEKYAKEMNVKQGTIQGPAMVQDLNRQYQQWVAEMNKQYTNLVQIAVGNGDGGPSANMKYQAETYSGYRTAAESAIRAEKEIIERTCQPVDQRALLQLIEEQKKAVSDMLLERLLRDLNARWNPNANCTLSVGKWFSMTIDIDGNTKFGGKWAPYKKAFDGSPTFDGPGNSKINLSEKSLSWTASKEYSKSGGIFTGKAGVTGGASIDPKTGKLSFPVNVSAKLGLGFKGKTRGGQEFGLTCFPGEFEAKFDARVIAQDAINYAKSLKR